jgi:glycerol-3-phosphate acyltransferase PlsY
MASPLTLCLCALFGYLLGSIPFGVIITRLGGAGDVRNIGSGNIGATNVLRTGRRDLALLTLICDAGKGAGAALIGAAAVSPLGGVIAAGAAFLGHLFPIWLGFRGGKGMATFFGVLFALAWPVGLIVGVVWIVIATALRFSSVASLAAAASAPAILALMRPAQPAAIWLVAAMAALVFVRHHENIGRLLKGAEPRIGGSKART